MGKDILSERERALENEFFYRRDQELLNKLREQIQRVERRQQLRAAGIQDPVLLDELDEAGIGAESLTALSLVPLVQVAWADRRVTDSERDAVLRAADASGIQRGSAGYQLLSAWLQEPPKPELLKAWKDYVRSLAATLSEEARGQLEEDVMGRARTVAEASGAFLGMGDPVSDAEEAMLRELAQAFRQ